MRHLFLIIIFICFLNCKNTNEKEDHPATLFTLIPAEKTKITFKNTIIETNSFNFLNYSYIYNGGGVAIGDINNDGLQDIYFSSNQQSNTLYLNKGDLEFEDITEKAKVSDSGGWTTGISMIDINTDGYLDIYVCKSGELRNPEARKNRLYINQQNGTFAEQAQQWNLADTGFSTQAYFLDYDKDGDLDIYLVNHRPDFGNITLNPVIEKNIIQVASDQLYRNDGNIFTNISAEAGIQNKAWGLSASIGDFNGDTWPDVYVCNDFSQPDYLYINDRHGGFTDQIQQYMNHITLNSMGSDYADINNDGLLDLVVLDMSSEDHIRSKSNMPAMSTEQFENMVKAGYHYQYMYNMLHLNTGSSDFAEIGQLANIAKTDWSWAPLLADFDNNGFKDLFVTNGILKDLSNVDFRNNLQQKIAKKDPMTLEGVIDMMPSTKLKNYGFRNNGDLTFSNTSSDWGLTAPSFSNGAAYADLDNDGDLDLVVNNLENRAFVYQNNASNNYIQVSLKGPKNNPLAIGTEVRITTNSNTQAQKQYPNRGFQSSVSALLTFGIDQATSVDTLTVIWPDGKQELLKNIDANAQITLRHNNAKPVIFTKNTPETILKQIDLDTLGIHYVHQENSFNDYNRQLLLPYKLSQNGPFMDTADVNADGLDDFFIGGASGHPGMLYIQQKNGTFLKSNQTTWEKDKDHEDLQMLFFDFDNDKDQDLYVVSGGNAFDVNNSKYQDRLYKNDGKGNFARTNDILPKNLISGQQLATADIDNDGDLDLFAGGRHIPGKYPYPPKSSLLENVHGVFKDITIEKGSELTDLGMITDAVFTDYDNDDDPDLLIVGEWMPITLFENDKGTFSKKSIAEFKHTGGLWFSITKKDIDNDGDEDYFAGNIGLNTKYKADASHSFHIYCDDFDNSGTYDIVLGNTYNSNLVPVRGKECSSQQMPFLNKKFQTYEAFAQASIEEIYGKTALEKALHYKADILYSIFIENKGNGSFSIQKLPNEMQVAPIMGFEFLDIDNDGAEELFSVGNLYPVEVETIRFDASRGNVLNIDNGRFEIEPVTSTGFKTFGDTRAIKKMMTAKGPLLFITNNNAAPIIFGLNKKILEIDPALPDTGRYP